MAHFVNALIMGVSSILFFLILIYGHSGTLTKADSAYGFISYASNAAILGYGFFPQLGTAIAAIGQNLFFAGLLALGSMLAIYDAIKGENRVRAYICLSCLLPLISLAVYVHTYIYFYTFLLAAASLTVAYGVFWITRRYPMTRFIIPICLMVSAAPVYIKSFHQTKTYQAQVNDVIHTMFPNPVNYIDRTSQISSFPKQGLFMTVVQMDEYKASGQFVMPSVFTSAPPEFVLANIESLKLDQVRERQPARRLMKKDEDLLVDNFIHHWGPIYVPGKRIEGQQSSQNIEITLPGTYTIESQSKVNINGMSYNPMAPLKLNKGSLEISTLDNKVVHLRWGHNLYKPDFAPLDTVIFHGF